MADLEMGAVIGGLRIESVAGYGGMGVVYKATHLALNRRVAVKVVAPHLAEDAEFRARFTQESRAAASIEHPHVVPILHAGEENGLLYLTMRFVEGTDLRQLIAQNGRLMPGLATGIVSQVAEALDAAHARGLVHRDVKPGNILIERRRAGGPHAYLTDFGLIKQTSATGGLTRTGLILGTIDYISPEQINGRAVDGRADVYSLGCVLYEALTGRVPFPRDNDAAKIWAHLEMPAPSPANAAPDLPPALDQVVRRALAKQPGDRHASAGELGRAAVGACATSPGEAGAGGAAAGAGEPSRPAAVASVAGAPPTPAPSAPPWWTATPAPESAAGRSDPGVPARVGWAPPVPPPRRSAPPIAAPPQRGQGPAPPARPSVPQQTGPRPAPVPVKIDAGLRSPPIGLPQVPAGRGYPPGPPASPRRRRTLVVGVAVVVLALVGGALVYLLSGTTARLEAGRIDGPSIAVGKEPYDIESGAGHLWTANLGSDTISKIDPVTGSRTDIHVGGRPTSLVVTNDAVWVWNYSTAVVRVDIATGRVGDLIRTGTAEINSIAAGNGYLWLCHTAAGTVSRINMATQKVEATPVAVGAKPVSMDYGDRFLYVVNAADRTVVTLDGATGSVVGQPLSVDGASGGIGVRDDVIYLWTGDHVTPVDERTFAIGTGIPVAGGSLFEIGAGSAWVVYPLDNVVRRIDLQTRAPHGEPITGIGKGIVDLEFTEDGTLWALNADQSTITRIRPAP